MRGPSLTVAASAALFAGCGAAGSDDPRQAVVEAFGVHQSALLDEDAETYCGTLTADAEDEILATVAGLGRGISGCEKSAEAIFEFAGKRERRRVERAREEVTTADVRLRGRRAGITLPSGRVLDMRQEDGEWLVADPSANRK